MYALMFLLTGIGFLYFTLGIWRENKRVSSWPETPGTIIKKNISRGSGRGEQFYPDVEYEFVVDGKKYQSNKVFRTFRENFTYKDAQSKLDKISNKTMVRYNPEKPNDCFLLTVEFGGLHWFFSILGIVFFAIGLLWTLGNVLLSLGK